MTRSSRPPPTLEELQRRRSQMLDVLGKETETTERSILEHQLEEIDEAIARTRTSRTTTGPSPV